jgi:hypothetical protein
MRSLLHEFIAFPHHPLLRVSASLSLDEWGGDIAAFGYAVELNSWMVNLIPDSGIRLTVVSPTFGRQGRLVR